MDEVKRVLLNPNSRPNDQKNRFKDAQALTNFKARPSLAILPVVYAIPAEVSLDRESSTLVFDAKSSALSGGGKPLRAGQALSAFAKLYDAGGNPNRLLRFARRYGPLHICEHMPSRGRESAWPGWSKHMRCELCPGPIWRENVEDWLYFAAEVNAMLTVQLALRSIWNETEQGMETDIREFLFLDDLECLPEVDFLNRKSASASLGYPNLEEANDDELLIEAEKRKDRRAREWVSGNVHHHGISAQPSDDQRLGIEIGNRVIFLAGALTLDLSGALSGKVQWTRCTNPNCARVIPRKSGPRGKCAKCRAADHRESNVRWYAGKTGKA